MIRTTNNGLTLIELVITIVMFIIIIGVAVYVFRAILISWSAEELRAGIDITVDRTVEEMVRVLRETKVVQSNNDEIRYTDLNDNDYIFYLYNADDPYPPQFDQASYELRMTTLAPDIDGAPVGLGNIIITDVVPPTTSDLSFDGSTITVDLSITRDDETIRSRTEIKPRNL